MKKKLDNVRKWTVRTLTVIAFIMLIFFGCCIDSGSAIPFYGCAVCLVWLCVVIWANSDIFIKKTKKRPDIVTQIETEAEEFQEESELE